MQWVFGFHIIFVMSWMAGLLYLPRLFVYHAMTTDKATLSQFKEMEHKLYFYITWPAAVMATLCGSTVFYSDYCYYLTQPWMLAKLGFIALMWTFHLSCWYFLDQFDKGINTLSHKFFRWYNEVPAVLMVLIVIMVTIKPGGS